MHFSVPDDFEDVEDDDHIEELEQQEVSIMNNIYMDCLEVTLLVDTKFELAIDLHIIKMREMAFVSQSLICLLTISVPWFAAINLSITLSSF